MKKTLTKIHDNETCKLESIAQLFIIIYAANYISGFKPHLHVIYTIIYNSKNEPVQVMLNHIFTNKR